MNRTLKEISYGLKTPQDLFEKLVHDAGKLKTDQHPYNIFNFMVTAGALTEWIKHHYELKRKEPNLWKAFEGKNIDNRKFFPNEVCSWFKNVSNIPQPKERPKLHIHNCIQACYSIYTASKHTYWSSNNVKVTAIEDGPIINNWWQYFFTGFDEGIYIEVDTIAYSLVEVATVLTTFYENLIKHLETK